MAVEEGLLVKNPTLGIKIKVPEVEQKVLTNAEAEILLKEGKLCITDSTRYGSWHS